MWVLDSIAEHFARDDLVAVAHKKPTVLWHKVLMGLAKGIADIDYAFAFECATKGDSARDQCKNGWGFGFARFEELADSR